MIGDEVPSKIVRLGIRIPEDRSRNSQSEHQATGEQPTKVVPQGHISSTSNPPTRHLTSSGSDATDANVSYECFFCA